MISTIFSWLDVRGAFRRLRASPLFTLLTVVVLAGGLGVSIFTWSFLHTTMIRPIPVDEGDRVVRLLTETNGATSLIDAADLAAIRAEVTTLEGLGAYADRQLIVGAGAGTRSLGGTVSEWNVFQITRTPPWLGRGFVEGDQAPGAEPVVVLSHWAWRVVFGADSTLLDRLVVLSGTPTRVIGVMPPGYGFPVAAEAWIPMGPALLSATVRGEQFLNAYARLAPGVSPRQAEAELSTLLLRARRADPFSGGERAEPTGVAVRSFPMAQMGEQGPLAFSVLNALAALILLLACINVTNLLLARANERARETAVRLALGASRGRLVTQSLWESVILVVVGGVLAVGIATWGLGIVDAWARSNLEGNLAFWWVWRFNWQLVLAAAGFVTLSLLVLGAVVSRRALTTNINAVLMEHGPRGGGRREGRIARLLVVTQVATVSVLMFFGSLAALIAYRVVNVDPGYDTRNLLSANLEPSVERYSEPATRTRFYQEVFDQLSGRAEIDGALLRTSLAAITAPDGEFELPDSPGLMPAPRTHAVAVLGPLTPLGVQLVEGRWFNSGDAPGAVATAMVSRSFAARYWPAGSPVGRQLRLAGLGDSEPVRTVVGVVSDVLLGNPLSRERSAVAVYVPLAQTAARRAAVMFRHRQSRPTAEAAFQETLANLDPLLVPDHIASFDEILAKSSSIARSVMVLFGVCLGFALLLAVSGTYGLMARSVSRRVREIGVRRALGASDRSVMGMLVGQSARHLGTGALVALPLNLVAAAGFSYFFPIAYGVSAGIALLVSAAITAIVLAASWHPARHALRVEPRDALGSE